MIDFDGYVISVSYINYIYLTPASDSKKDKRWALVIVWQGPSVPHGQRIIYDTEELCKEALKELRGRITSAWRNRTYYPHSI